MSVVSIVKISLLSLGVVCLLAGIAVTFAGMFTARWQVADFGPQMIHEHGLWKDCSNADSQSVKSVNEWICIFKFDKANRDPAHQMKGMSVCFCQEDKKMVMFHCDWYFRLAASSSMFTRKRLCFGTDRCYLRHGFLLLGKVLRNSLGGGYILCQ